MKDDSRNGLLPTAWTTTPPYAAMFGGGGHQQLMGKDDADQTPSPGAVYKTVNTLDGVGLVAGLKRCVCDWGRDVMRTT